MQNLFNAILQRNSSDMHKALCKGRPGLCDAMKPTKGADLLKYLRKVNFIGELNEKLIYPTMLSPCMKNFLMEKLFLFMAVK